MSGACSVVSSSPGIQARARPCTSRFSAPDVCSSTRLWLADIALNWTRVESWLRIAVSNDDAFQSCPASTHHKPYFLARSAKVRNWRSTSLFSSKAVASSMTHTSGSSGSPTCSLLYR